MDYTEPTILSAGFPAGSLDNATACVSLTIIDDNMLEGDETLTVQVVSVSDSSVGMNRVNLGTNTTGSLTIEDNDGNNYSWLTCT